MLKTRLKSRLPSRLLQFLNSKMFKIYQKKARWGVAISFLKSFIDFFKILFFRHIFTLSKLKIWIDPISNDPAIERIFFWTISKILWILLLMDEKLIFKFQIFNLKKIFFFLIFFSFCSFCQFLRWCSKSNFLQIEDTTTVVSFDIFCGKIDIYGFVSSDPCQNEHILENFLIWPLIGLKYSSKLTLFWHIL